MEIFIATAGDQGAVYDAHSSTLIGNFKGMPADKHCFTTVCVPGHGFARPSMLVTASKAILNIHSIAKEPSMQKLIASEKLSSLAVSHDGLFMAAGMESGRIFVWEFGSGDLLSAFEAHYKAVTVLRFTEDDEYLVSGSADASVHLWAIGDCADTSSGPSTIKPTISLTEHTLAITDIYCSFGQGARIMLWTASADRTCKLWETQSGGHCLLTLIYPSPPRSVIMNRTESIVLVGVQDGTIYRFDLRDHLCPGNVIHINDNMGAEGIDSDEMGRKQKYLYHLHKQPVNCLQLSIDGSLLYSGCDEGLVHCWDLQSGQKMRSWGPLKGPVTNLQLLIKPEALFAGTGALGVDLIYPVTLKRTVTAPYDGMTWRMTVSCADYEQQLIDKLMTESESATFPQTLTEKVEQVETDAFSGGNGQMEVEQLKEQIKQLKQINSELFQQLIRQNSTSI